MRVFLIGMMALFQLGQVAHGVVAISGGPNNTAPAGQPYFGNIGTIGNASAIYLGDGWVLTANHVASSLPGAVNFAGTSYATEPGSHQRLENAAPYSTYTDIVLFRLSTLASFPALPTLGISSSTPTVGNEVMMIGNGRSQLEAPTYWNRTVIDGNNNDTWVETTPELANIGGFKTSGTHEVRWGENTVSENSVLVNVGTELFPVDVVSFTTSFSASGMVHEAQGVVGDSGGGVFGLNGGSWELAGMMFAVATYENQPGGSQTAVWGNLTAIADLSYYREQIYAAIPEPSALVFALLGGLALGRRRR